MLLTLTPSQQSLLDCLDDVDCVQYLTKDGLEIHDVAVSALLGAIVSIAYPQDELDQLVGYGLIELITPDLQPWVDRAYYAVFSLDQS